jgi:hypothetical protein
LSATIKRPVHRQGGAADQQGVAIRIGARDRLGADIGAAAAFVLDDDLLAPDFGQRIGDDAGDRVGRSSRRIGHHEPHETARPRLRASGAREEDGRERRCRRQGDELAAVEHAVTHRP